MVFQEPRGPSPWFSPWFHVVAIDVLYLYNIIRKTPGGIKYRAHPARQMKAEVGNSAQTV